MIWKSENSTKGKYTEVWFERELPDDLDNKINIHVRAIGYRNKNNEIDLTLLQISCDDVECVDLLNEAVDAVSLCIDKPGYNL
tara:strand:- start:1852 stop:2100 length:249 start_codon:yes stop_codon:yes gene_type:complete